MISHVLDTNAVIALLSGKASKLSEKIVSRPVGDLALPTIVVHELYFGAYRSQRVERNLDALKHLTANFPKLDFDERDARVAGNIRAMLAELGTPIGPRDVLIAGQAKARGLTVVTNNVREFIRVPDLSVEDWTL